MPLSQRDQTIISSLSRSDVEKTLAGLKRFTTDSRWLGKNNCYSLDIVEKIKLEILGGGITNPRHLSHYIAASCLLHCADGWSYLGKAILSLLRGDPHRSRHLAYYAELRATMSLLATAGIGVFNNKHFVISAPQIASPLGGGGGTHQFAWNCLVSWAQQNASGDLFANIVRPHGRDLQDWLAPLGGGSAVAPQAQGWFRQWGMDLDVLSKDRDARNESSYRPDGLPNAWSIDAANTIRFVKELWSTLEPSSTSSFENIDRHILRLSIESIFMSRQGISAIEAPNDFAKFAQSIVSHQNMSPAMEMNWVRFITRADDVSDPSIFSYSKNAPEIGGDSAFAVASRATLLLRIASGSNLKLFRDAGYNIDSIAFWWRKLGQDRGLWDNGRDASELTDLWSDIEVCIDDVERFHSIAPPENQTFSRFAIEHGNTFPSFGSCELAAIWGMAVI